MTKIVQFGLLIKKSWYSQRAGPKQKVPRCRGPGGWAPLKNDLRPNQSIENLFAVHTLTTVKCPRLRIIHHMSSQTAGLWCPDISSSINISSHCETKFRAKLCKFPRQTMATNYQRVPLCLMVACHILIDGWTSFLRSSDWKCTLGLWIWSNLADSDPDTTMFVSCPLLLVHSCLKWKEQSQFREQVLSRVFENTASIVKAALWIKSSRLLMGFLPFLADVKCHRGSQFRVKWPDRQTVSAELLLMSHTESHGHLCFVVLCDRAGFCIEECLASLAQHQCIMMCL